MQATRLLLIFCCLGLLADTNAAESALKVMTFNLRYASDSKPNSWPERRPVMKQCIAEADADIIGTQEGVYHQLKDIENDSPQYRWVGLGREGGSKGEFMAVYYKPARFDAVEYDHFWLSDTPEVMGSVTWGHSVKRMVTWVRFKDLQTSRQFYLVNTHFDHQVQGAREKAAELVLARVKKLDATLPVIVMGDFNAAAGANKAYETLTSDKYLTDTWHAAKERRGEVVRTFHNFRGPVAGDARIDWILGRGIETAWTQILTCHVGTQYPSDHFAVIAAMSLK